MAEELWILTMQSVIQASKGLSIEKRGRNACNGRLAASAVRADSGEGQTQHLLEVHWQYPGVLAARSRRDTRGGPW